MIQQWRSLFASIGGFRRRAVIRNSAPGVPSLSSPVHQWSAEVLTFRISWWQESGLGRRGNSHKLSRDEGGSARLEYLPSQNHRRVSHAHEQQWHSGGISKEARGHCFQGNMWSGAGDCGLVTAALGDTFCEVHPWEEESLGRSFELPRPGPSHWIVSSSPGCSSPSARCLGVLALTCLLREQKQNNHCMCVWFWIPWHGNRTPFNILGTISVPMHFPPSLFSSLVESDAFNKSLLDPGSSSLASEGVVLRSSGSRDGGTSQASLIEVF